MQIRKNVTATSLFVTPSSILMYLAEYMSTVGEFGGNVQIIPFDQSDVSSMGPIIDFVISKGSTYDGGAFYSQVILKDRLTLSTSDNLWVWPSIICTNKDDMAQHHFCAIFQSSDASLNNLEVDLPYASILAPFCRRSVGYVFCSHRATIILNLDDV